MKKAELIEKIMALPDDAQIFVSVGNYDELDVRIFPEYKDEAFIQWYFGP